MITITLFFISLFGIMFLFINKKRELDKGEAFVCLSHCDEHHLRNKFREVQVSLREMPRRAGNIVAFLVVKQGVRAFEKLKKVVYPKISHIVDAVKGRDIPKNKGSVSLFLRHIERFRDMD